MIENIEDYNNKEMTLKINKTGVAVRNYTDGVTLVLCGNKYYGEDGALTFIPYPFSEEDIDKALARIAEANPESIKVGKKAYALYLIGMVG